MADVGYFTNKPVEAKPINMHQIHRMPYYGDDCIIVGFVTWSDKEPRDITLSDYNFLCDYYGRFENFARAELLTSIPQGWKPLPNFRPEYLKLVIAEEVTNDE